VFQCKNHCRPSFIRKHRLIVNYQVEGYGSLRGSTLHTASRLLADDECKWEQAGCIKVLWMGARYLIFEDESSMLLCSSSLRRLLQLALLSTLNVQNYHSSEGAIASQFQPIQKLWGIF